MIVQATNCNRTYAAKDKSLAADFVSDVIDFKDMCHGSIHARWYGATGALDGTFRIYASDFPDVASFDPNGTLIDGAVFAIHSLGDGSRIWIRDRLSFRYALVRYSSGTVSGGTVDVVAIGKKA